jgi:hypothetical protein
MLMLMGVGFAPSALPLQAGKFSISALGQKRTYAVQKAMSALPPIATAKADISNPACLL